MFFNIYELKTKQLLEIYNAFADRTVNRFSSRQKAEEKLDELIRNTPIFADDIYSSELISDLTKDSLKSIIESKTDQKVRSRVTPKFETHEEKEAYISTRYRSGSKFPGRRSRFAKCTLKINNFLSCPYRPGTVLANSFNIIYDAGTIVYEDFRMAGGRNTDLQAMVDKKVVSAVN